MIKIKTRYVLASLLVSIHMNVLKLLSVTVCTLVIDCIDKDALGNRVG